MGSPAPFPSEPQVSPLAEAVTAFEESDPDAVALLLPFDSGLTPERIEARARRKFPTRSADERAEAITQAVAIQELILATIAARPESAVKVAVTPAVSKEERERRWRMLAAAIEHDPAMTAAEGLKLLNEQGDSAVAHSTFHNVYWREALGRVPPHIRELRRGMTAHRPGNGKLPRSEGDRSRVRNVVAVIRRDHPGWHRGQIMDEVRKVTAFEFQDPIAFERNYIATVEPAPPDAPARTSPPEPPAAPARESWRAPIPAAVRRAPSVETAAIRAPVQTDGTPSLLDSLLSITDPLLPAELRPADDGRVQVCLNLRSTDAVRSYQLMSRLYAEMARLAVGSEG